MEMKITINDVSIKENIKVGKNVKKEICRYNNEGLEIGEIAKNV